MSQHLMVVVVVRVLLLLHRTIERKEGKQNSPAAWMKVGSGGNEGGRGGWIALAGWRRDNSPLYPLNGPRAYCWR